MGRRPQERRQKETDTRHGDNQQEKHDDQQQCGDHPKLSTSPTQLLSPNYKSEFLPCPTSGSLHFPAPLLVSNGHFLRFTGHSVASCNSCFLPPQHHQCDKVQLIQLMQVTQQTLQKKFQIKYILAAMAFGYINNTTQIVHMSSLDILVSSQSVLSFLP